MLIYLAHPTDPSGQQAVSEAVRDRGLLMLRAKPCEIRITIVPDVHQPGYVSYIHNLSAYMEATITQKVVEIRNRGYPLKNVPLMIPMTLPPLIYDFPTKPNDAKITKLRDHSTVVQGRTKSVSFIMQTPTLDLIRDVANQTANQTTAHVFGTVNISGMKCVFVIQKILSAFLLTHTYPAFRNAEEMTPQEVPIDVSIKRRKTNHSSYLLCVSKPDEHLEELPPQGIGTDGDQTMNDPYDPATQVKLTRAKPSTITDKTWGSSDNIPNCSGVFVPFVEELAVQDTLTVPNLVATYFVRSLAGTPEGMFAKMEELRSGWSMVSATRLGHEWSHLCKCIDIALQAQCFVYPVYTNDIYEGTVICGAGYTIGWRSRVFGPSTYQDLQQLVIDNSMHNISLQNIVIAVGVEHRDEIHECENMRMLAKLLCTYPLDEVSKNDVVKHAMKLNFSNKYWSTSASNVKEALEYLKDPEKEIPCEIPMFPKYLFSTDRDEVVLSAFGHQAPTFMIPNGRKCDISSMTDPPKNLTIRTVPIQSAVLDLKYIRQNGFITNNMSNLSSKHKDTPIKSEVKRDVWSLLKGLVQSGAGSDENAQDEVIQGDEVGGAIDADLGF